MNKVKIKDKKTGVVKEVKKSLVGDFLGTGNFEIVEEKKPLFTKKDEEKN